MAVIRHRVAIAVLVVGSMLCSSGGAAAAMTSRAPAYQPDSWAVLAAMSGGAPAAAICESAAVTAQTAPGCVLPQADAAVAPIPPAQPSAVSAAERAGVEISPLLIALATFAGGAALYFIFRHHHDRANSPA